MTVVCASVQEAIYNERDVPLPYFLPVGDIRGYRDFDPDLWSNQTSSVRVDECAPLCPTSCTKSDSSTQGQKSTVVGGGTALLQNDRKCFGAQRESLIREHSVPILEKETMDLLGTVTFTFVLAGPFSYLNTPTPTFNSLEESDLVQLVGHRGAHSSTLTELV